MEKRKGFKLRVVDLLLALLPISLLLPLCACSDPIFYEPFDETFEGRWIVSKKEDYKGVWKHEKSEGHEDYGLLVSEKAKKYAIMKELDKPIELKGQSIVLQFETRFQNDLECGGAYIKYLRPQEASWGSKEFDNKSPYSIMFGPDKCGSTNKVHFILKHMNPTTGEFIEHHLKYPPPTPHDKLTHVYTAILKPDNELRILIDGEEKKAANFLSSDDFEPALVPSKTIADPDDKKPEDWDEREKIPDPHAVKPDDWDEDAPMEIPDEEAEKPEGWLDDEPEEIDDPEASKPEDWDDEEDGEWETPKIDNPKCEDAPGCGEWKMPMKRNPEYKGRWFAPLIENPHYKGIWEPRQIPNPDYFELDTPNIEPIAALGIEIWTMQDGILFDNILIANDEKTAESYRKTAWKPKYDVEKKKQKEEDEASGLSDGLTGLKKKAFDLMYMIADLSFLESRRTKILEWIEWAETQPNLTVSIMVSIVVVILSIMFKIFFGGKKPASAKKTQSNKTGSGDDIVDASSKSAGKADPMDNDKTKKEVVAPEHRADKSEN